MEVGSEMPKTFMRLILLVLIIEVSLVTSVQAQKQDVLDNGLIRVSFDENTRLFHARSLHGGVLRLFGAGPAYELARASSEPATPYQRGTTERTVSAHQATKIEVNRRNFDDQLGQGEKLIVNYSFGGALPSLRYELAIYRGKPWLSVVAYLSQGDYRLGNVSVVQGKVHTLNAFGTRVYVNSGTAGGDSGVWPLGLRRLDSASLSVLYEPHVRDALGLEFYSFYRASTSVTVQYLGSDEIGVDAAAHYYGYRPQNGELQTERLLLDFAASPLGPLRMLDDWVEAVVQTVHPHFNHDARRGFLNCWYIYGDRITADDIVRQANLLRHSVLPSYGITSVFLGEWQLQHPETGNVGDIYGFGEDQADSRLFPKGVQWLANQILGMGLQTVFGANYAYAAPHSGIAQRHEPWIDWNDFARLNFGYPIDFSDPRAEQWLYNLAHRTVEYHAVEWWDDFDGGPTRSILHDPTKIMQFEDIREGLKTIRRAIGSNVAMHQFCCGPYFTYVGLVDRVRVGIDAPALGDWQGFKAMARQFAANYMLHQRLWVIDPDPVFVGGRYNRDIGSGPLGLDPALLHEIRMRLQEQIISGGPVTIGENIADFTPERLHLLTLVLPVYGKAARPLDLFIHTAPEVYDLAVRTNWDQWHVLLVQNWNHTNKTYTIRFSKLGLDGNKRYLVFRFWDQHLVGQFRDRVNLNVGAEEGEAYAIRSVPAHPWVLSTDMHLTQGGVELQDVHYDNSTQQLSGVASRHPGDLGHVVIYAPAGYRVRSASGPYRSEHQSSGAEVIYLQIKFDQRSAPWSISFEKTE
jgi:hypothetical protein